DRIVVFQNGALFPWKTLAQNVAYRPMVQGVLSKRNARAKAHEMRAEAGLGEFGGKYPGEVSSGMARRAEIVRALINKPKGLLLDEPYRAMDGLTKSIMHEALLEVFDRTKVTIFFITHDLEEAIFLGDRVYVLTTRPCRLKKVVNVDIPRPRNYEVLSSEQFRLLVDETKDAVHEEAIKAFQLGEREVARARREAVHGQWRGDQSSYRCRAIARRFPAPDAGPPGVLARTGRHRRISDPVGDRLALQGVVRLHPPVCRPVAAPVRRGGGLVEGTDEMG